MRLTADVLLQKVGYLNVIGEREISLRGHQIPAIENLAVLEDQFNCLDFTDNAIKKIDNFPLMNKVTTLLFHNNQISKVSSDIGKKLPFLQNLVLTGNNITQLYELRALVKCPKLEHVVVLDNPVCMHPNYRLFMIYHLCCLRKSLHGAAGVGVGGFPHGIRTLDYQKVTARERELAEKLFTSEAGRELLETLKEQRSNNITPTHPQVPSSSSTSSAGAVDALSAEQRQVVRRAVEAAKTEEEIARIELQLQTGQFPFEQYAARTVKEKEIEVVVEKDEAVQKPHGRGRKGSEVEPATEEEEVPAPAKKGRGRKGSEIQPAATEQSEQEPVKRSRRRKESDVTEDIQVEPQAEVEPVKRGGRKRKNSEVVEATVVEPVEEPEPGKRGGRKRKNSDADAVEAPPPKAKKVPAKKKVKK